jgi:hypothetical protein
MDFYRRCRNVAHTCRHFGISRQTFYRWQRRYDPYDLTTLEERSHCPRRRRQPTWSFLLEEKVLGLRLQFPRWGKDKLAVLLRRQKLPISMPIDSNQLQHSEALSGRGHRVASSVILAPINESVEKLLTLRLWAVLDASKTNKTRSPLLSVLDLNPRFPPTIRVSLTTSQVLRRPPEVTQVV